MNKNPTAKPKANSSQYPIMRILAMHIKPQTPENPDQSAGGGEIVVDRPKAKNTVTGTMPDGLIYQPQEERYRKDKATGITFGCDPKYTPAQQNLLEQKILKDRLCHFSFSIMDLPGYTGIMPPASITLSHDRPIFEAQRRHSEKEKKVEADKIEEMLQAGLIEPSISNKWCSNLTFPPKKAADGQWTEQRMCNDLRALNEATITDKYPTPKIEEQLDACLKSACFSLIDCRAGYNQVGIRCSDRPKTTFWHDGRRFQYTRMAMGMKNATANFQRIMDHCLGAAGLSHCAFAYVDDVLIHSPNPEQHIKDVCAVLDAMHKDGLKAHPEKCILGTDVIPFLGHNVSAWGLTPQACKIQAILELPAPTTVSELRSCLGLFRYYACYSPNYSADVLSSSRINYARQGRHLSVSTRNYQ